MLRAENSENPATYVKYEQIPQGVRDLFAKWTDRIDTKQEMETALLPRCPEWHVSLIKGLHVLMVEVSVEAQRKLGFPNIRKNMNANLPHLHKGTQVALAADPTLEKARAANEALGRPGIQKSIEVRRANDNFAGLAKGRETRTLQAQAKSSGLDPSLISQAQKEFVCNEGNCDDRKFNNKQGLSSHRQIEHENKRFESDWKCGQPGYMSCDGAKKHMKSEHNGVKMPTAIRQSRTHS